MFILRFAGYSVNLIKIIKDMEIKKFWAVMDKRRHQYYADEGFTRDIRKASFIVKNIDEGCALFDAYCVPVWDIDGVIYQKSDIVYASITNQPNSHTYYIMPLELEDVSDCGLFKFRFNRPGAFCVSYSDILSIRLANIAEQTQFYISRAQAHIDAFLERDNNQDESAEAFCSLLDNHLETTIKEFIDNLKPEINFDLEKHTISLTYKI